EMKFIIQYWLQTSKIKLGWIDDFDKIIMKYIILKYVFVNFVKVYEFEYGQKNIIKKTKTVINIFSLQKLLDFNEISYICDKISKMALYKIIDFLHEKTTLNQKFFLFKKYLQIV
ncbi:hypothetical protein RFI_37400, partial [Reticulomyxa filosa]